MSHLPTIKKSYHFRSFTGSSGDEFVGGFYSAPVTDANLTQASLTVVLGSANNAYGAHVFAVAAAAGVTDGSDLVLTVTGTSITEGGVRTGSDSEVIVATATAASLNDYFETAKKWIGQVTYTLSSTGGTTFNFDFNYGFAEYDDLSNVNFRVIGFECVGLAGANDSGFNIQLFHHNSSGWTYDATAFVPGGIVIADMNVDYGAEQNLVNGEFISYKRNNLSEQIDGMSPEGLLIDITTGANAAIDYMDIHIIASKY